jgi:hypothetical protein
LPIELIGSTAARPKSACALELTGTEARADTLAPLTLAADLEPAELPPYARLPLDILTGTGVDATAAPGCQQQRPLASMTREPHERMTGPWSPLQHVHPRMHREMALDAGHARDPLGRAAQRFGFLARGDDAPEMHGTVADHDVDVGMRRDP